MMKYSEKPTGTLLRTVVCVASGRAAIANDAALDEVEITSWLTVAVVHKAKDGRGWSQTFNHDGSTAFTSGGPPSYGAWIVRDDRYCSVWPPSEIWSRWRVEQRQNRSAFIQETSGNEWPANRVHQ